MSAKNDFLAFLRQWAQCATKDCLICQAFGYGNIAHMREPGHCVFLRYSLPGGQI